MEHLFPHTLQIKELRVVSREGGVPVHDYELVTTKKFPCRWDIGFRRPQDPIVPPEAGRPPDRFGVLFTTPEAGLLIRYGYQLVITRYVRLSNSFVDVAHITPEGSLDQAEDFEDLHHYEIYCKEMARGVNASG